MQSFKEYHNNLKKSEEFYCESLEKAKLDSHGDIKKFTKLAASFVGNTKPRIKTCVKFLKILDDLTT